MCEIRRAINRNKVKNMFNINNDFKELFQMKLIEGIIGDIHKVGK